MIDREVLLTLKSNKLASFNKKYQIMNNRAPFWTLKRSKFRPNFRHKKPQWIPNYKACRCSWPLQTQKLILLLNKWQERMLKFLVCKFRLKNQLSILVAAKERSMIFNWNYREFMVSYLSLWMTKNRRFLSSINYKTTRISLVRSMLP